MVRDIQEEVILTYAAISNRGFYCRGKLTCACCRDFRVPHPAVTATVKKTIWPRLPPSAIIGSMRKRPRLLILNGGHWSNAQRVLHEGIGLIYALFFVKTLNRLSITD